MGTSNATAMKPDLRLVMRTAIAHARHRLAEWLTPDGTSHEVCLAELTKLLFHPAIDVLAAAQPATRDRQIQIMWTALCETRNLLKRANGPRSLLPADECLDEILWILDNQNTLAAADLRPMITVIQWGPAFERRRPPTAWCMRRAMGV